MFAGNNFKVILFYSTHKTLQAEKALKESEVPAIIIPIPKEISSDCGLGLKFKNRFESEVIQALENSNIEYSRIFAVNN